MNKQHQTSQFCLKNLEEDGVFMGYASVFDCVDFQNDQVLPGAFAKSLEHWRTKQSWPKNAVAARPSSPYWGMA